MLCDVSQTQPILFSTKLSNALPKNTIDVIFLLLIYETIPSWGKSCYLFSVDKVERINARCAMTVCAHRVDISHKGSIWSSILELGLWVCTKETAVRTDKRLFRTFAQISYNLETHICVVFESQKTHHGIPVDLAGQKQCSVPCCQFLSRVKATDASLQDFQVVRDRTCRKMPFITYLCTPQGRYCVRQYLWVGAVGGRYMNGSWAWPYVGPRI